MDRHAERVRSATPVAAKLGVDDLDNCATPCATTVVVQLGDAPRSVYIGQISRSTRPSGEDSDLQGSTNSEKTPRCASSSAGANRTCPFLALKCFLQLNLLRRAASQTRA